MLKAYEVMIENGQIRWLKEQPNIKSARAVITLLDDDVLVTESVESFASNEPKLEELGGSEPQAQTIPRRRYDI